MSGTGAIEHGERQLNNLDPKLPQLNRGKNPTGLKEAVRNLSQNPFFNIALATLTMFTANHFFNGRNIPTEDIAAASDPGSRKVITGEMTSKRPYAESLASITGPFGPRLEVDDNWLAEHPSAVQAQADRIDPATGEAIEKYVVLNNTLTSLNNADWQNSKVYRAVKGPAGYGTYVLALTTGLQHAGALSRIFEDELLMVGEKNYRSGDAAGEKCSLTTLSCEPVNFPPGTYGFPDQLTKVLEDPNKNISFVDLRTEGGQKYIVEIQRPGGVQVSQIINKITSVGIGASGVVEITNNPSTGEARVIGVASQRGDRGIDFSSINYNTHTAETENLLASELGFVWAQAIYTDSLGKHLMVGNTDFDFLAGVNLDSEGRPTIGDYKINFSSWFNNAKAPNLVKDMGSIYGLYGVKARADGKLVAGFIGAYPAGVWPNVNSHATIGYAILDVQNTVPYAENVFWKDLAPLTVGNKDVSTLLPTQNKLQVKTVNGRLGVEFPINSYGNLYAGMRFAEINPNDYTLTGKIYNPNNGLSHTDYMYRLLLPLGLKNNLN